jgi:hypothetical protein
MLVKSGLLSLNTDVVFLRQHGARDGSRIFVALFDYDPPTMSPNPEACDEELPFREGQLIKVPLQRKCVFFVRI